MKSHEELKEQLEKLSKVKDTEFTFEIQPYKSGYDEDVNLYDFSIVTIKTTSNWLNLDKIEGIRGLKLSKYDFDNNLTALFSVKHY